MIDNYKKIKEQERREALLEEIKAVQDYNIMMGLIEDPEAEDDEDE